MRRVCAAARPSFAPGAVLMARGCSSSDSARRCLSVASVVQQTVPHHSRPFNLQGVIRVLPGLTHPATHGLDAARALLLRKRAAFLRAAVALRIRADGRALAETGAAPQAAAVEAEVLDLLQRTADTLGEGAAEGLEPAPFLPPVSPPLSRVCSLHSLLRPALL